MGEDLDRFLRAEVTLGRINGVRLPGGNKQQLIAQYADDTTLSILGKAQYVSSTVAIFESFRLASGMVINWLKSQALWVGKSWNRSAWLDQYNWRWGVKGQLRKFFGAPFGLNLNRTDVDAFPRSRIVYKLEFWSTTYL